jgi:hypothetical protein
LQKDFVPYDHACLNVPPGALIEKTFFLEAFPVAAPGAGFSRPVQTALELFPPYSLDGASHLLPPVGGVKAGQLDTRPSERLSRGGLSLS